MDARCTEWRRLLDRPVEAVGHIGRLLDDLAGHLELTNTKQARDDAEDLNYIRRLLADRIAVMERENNSTAG